jgi:hypothetical protein
VTFVEASTYKAFQGTGQVTGQEYRIVGSPFGNTIVRSSGPFPVTQTYVTTANVIGQGQPDPGPAFQIHIREHFTVNADGDVTAEVVESASSVRSVRPNTRIALAVKSQRTGAVRSGVAASMVMAPRLP